MYDIGVFLGFVAIVLSPCFVAFRSRVRSDRAEMKIRSRVPQTSTRRPVPQRVDVTRAAFATSQDKIVRQSARPYRAKTLHSGSSPLARPTPTSLFIAPVKRTPTLQVAHRTSRKSTYMVGGVRQANSQAKDQTRNQIKMRGVCIRPIRREFLGETPQARQIFQAA